MGKSQGDGEASGWSNNSESIHIQKNGNLVIKCFCLIKIKKSLTALTEVTLVSLSLTHTQWPSDIPPGPPVSAEARVPFSASSSFSKLPHVNCGSAYFRLLAVAFSEGVSGGLPKPSAFLAFPLLCAQPQNVYHSSEIVPVL